MGYLFLAVALASGLIKGYCGKRTSGAVKGIADAMVINTLRMILCIVIGSGFVFAKTGGFSALKIDTTSMLICFISGLSVSVFVVSWIVAVRQSAYMLLDVFLMLGVILPLTLGNLLFDEKIRLIQLIGFGLLLIATFVMCSYNNSVKAKLTPKTVGLLIITGIGNGMCSFSQKWFVKTVENGNISVFNFYTYLFSAILLLAFLVVLTKGRLFKKETVEPLKRSGWYIVVMSVCLFLNSFFMTKAATMLDSMQTYPLSQGGGLILSTLMSGLVFKEKITGKCIVGIVITFSALLMINLL